jgi:hypothetical protein
MAIAKSETTRHYTAHREKPRSSLASGSVGLSIRGKASEAKNNRASAHQIEDEENDSFRLPKFARRGAVGRRL